MRAAALLLALLLAQLGGAEAQGRGDRNMNSGQGTSKANDKCTFVYKARPARAAATPPLPLRGLAGQRLWLAVPPGEQPRRPQPQRSTLRRASPAGEQPGVGRRASAPPRARPFACRRRLLTRLRLPRPSPRRCCRARSRTTPTA